MILNEDFIKAVNNVNLFSSSSDNPLVSSIVDLSESLDILYDLLADELSDSIYSYDIRHDMEEWLYLNYLSNVARNFKVDLDVINSDIELDISDEFSNKSISIMREYYSYGVFDGSQSLYLDTRELGNREVIYVGNVREDGYIVKDGLKDIYPVNEAVSIALREENIDREDLFHESELLFEEYSESMAVIGDSGGYSRIKPNAIIKKLGVHKDGRIVYVHEMLQIMSRENI